MVTVFRIGLGGVSGLAPEPELERPQVQEMIRLKMPLGALTQDRRRLGLDDPGLLGMRQLELLYYAAGAAGQQARPVAAEPW
jgi:hypothetical protein